MIHFFFLPTTFKAFKKIIAVLVLLVLKQVWLAPVKQNNAMIIYYCYFLHFKVLALCLALNETQEIVHSLLTVSELTAQRLGQK